MKKAFNPDTGEYYLIDLFTEESEKEGHCETLYLFFGM